MSEAHQGWTEKEHKAHARAVHAANRLTKLTALIKDKAAELKTLRAEKKQLQQMVKSEP